MVKESRKEAGMNNFYVALFIAILVIIITTLLLRKLKRGLRTVVLTGLSESGKTALFTKLVFNKPKKSVTSLKENEATLSEYQLRLVDIPGAERLRSRFWEQYRVVAQRVIFVVDSTTVEQKLRELCEYLYSLLSDETLYENKIRFSIACNKQDLSGAKRTMEIKEILEKELDAIRATKSGQLGKTSNEDDTDYLARLDSKTLTFDNLGVNFIETSVHNLDQLVKLVL